MHFVVAPHTIYCWLRVNGEVAELVHLGKLFNDERRLGCRRLGGPRKFGQVTTAETSEESVEVKGSGGVSPKVISVRSLGGSQFGSSIRMMRLTVIPMDTG